MQLPPQPYVEAGDALPAAYTDADAADAGAADTPASQDVPPTPPPPAALAAALAAAPPPTNFLAIARTDVAITGTYAIDPSIPAAPAATPARAEDGRPLNLSLSSDNGSIDAVVVLLRAADGSRPALLDARSQNGSIALTVRDEHQQRFSLRAASATGAVTLRLPPTFAGPISTHLQNGRLVFSPAVQARLTTFSADAHDGRFFAGDGCARFRDAASWPGDSVRVDAQNGRVRIAWAGERVERKGFFKRFF